MEGKVLFQCGFVYSIQGYKDKALKLYEKCLELQERVKGKDSIETSLTLRNIGKIYSHQGNTNKALEYYYECLKIQ